jgi:50S ribosomal subunit-associated GTPase HflX
LIDASNARWEQHLESVEKILTDLELNSIPRLVVFNKADLVDAETLEAILRQTCATGARNCVAVSATNPRSLRPMLEAVGSILALDLTTLPGSRDESEGQASDDLPGASHPEDEVDAVAAVKASDTVDAERAEGEIHEADEEDLEYAARIAR